jgi:hypothetical protein
VKRNDANRSRRLGLGFFPSNPLVWGVLSVMFACLVLWAFSEYTALFILAAVLSGLGVL